MTSLSDGRFQITIGNSFTRTIITPTGSSLQNTSVVPSKSPAKTSKPLKQKKPETVVAEKKIEQVVAKKTEQVVEKKIEQIEEPVDLESYKEQVNGADLAKVCEVAASLKADSDKETLIMSWIENYGLALSEGDWDKLDELFTGRNTQKYVRAILNHNNKMEKEAKRELIAKKINNPCIDITCIFGKANVQEWIEKYKASDSSSVDGTVGEYHILLEKSTTSNGTSYGITISRAATEHTPKCLLEEVKENDEEIILTQHFMKTGTIVDKIYVMDQLRHYKFIKADDVRIPLNKGYSLRIILDVSGNYVAHVDCGRLRSQQVFIIDKKSEGVFVLDQKIKCTWGMNVAVAKKVKETIESLINAVKEGLNPYTSQIPGFPVTGSYNGKYVTIILEGEEYIFSD